MDKETMSAYEKMQRRENFVRIIRDQKALGKIGYADYQTQIAEIDKRFRLTEKERVAYELYQRIQNEQQRRRNRK